MKIISYLKTGIWVESTARHSWPHRARAACAAQPADAVAHRNHGREPRSGSKPDPIVSNPTR
jgi:hypothetical protein